MTPTLVKDRRARRRPGRLVVLACAALGAPALTGAALAAPAAAGSAPATAVVVQAPGAVARAEASVRAAGGSVTKDLPIVQGFSARVPADRLAALRALPGVVSVTADRRMHAQTYSSDLGYDPAVNTGSLYDVASIIGATSAYRAGYAGKGVDVALIDSGVAPVKGLTSGNVVTGPDLSLDSQEGNLRDNDGFGHGTHMASIIVGRDVPQASPAAYADQTRFNGIAPDARLVDVKVGAADGGVDVSQVIAGLNWVVEHRQTDGLDIRVVNLSYGTDGTQAYQQDPLAYAVEAAWKAGIVVVVSGGNDGSTRDYLAMPAQDPLVLSVGADDPMGTVSTRDDAVPSWASKGGTAAQSKHVDLVAPGVHVLGLRSPNSSIDVEHPSARTGSRFIRGNGTSQAAAVVSGAVALYLQKYPAATPDQVKKALVNQSVSFSGASQVYRGSGVVNVGNALGMAVPTSAAQGGWTPAAGTGSLELSRGSAHVVDYADDTTATPTVLSGERDIFGNAFSSQTWAGLTARGTTWQGGSWLGYGWSGDAFTDAGWTGRTWSGRTWSGTSWAGRTWSGRTWSSRTWSGGSWDSRTWSGRTWSGDSWSGRTWSGQGWSGVDWQ